MEVFLGQHFSGSYPPEAAIWCNTNNAMIVKDGDGYTITAVPEPEAPTMEELFASLRAERERRIAATDYLLLPDYPLKDGDRALVTAYRQSLRDLPAEDGAPWDGGGEGTPWPERPALGAWAGAAPCA